MGFPEIGCALTAFWQNWEHSREKEARKCLEMKGETLDLEGWKPSSSQPERQSNKQSSESSRICSAESSSRPTELLRHKKHRYMFLVSDQSQQILLHKKTHRQKTEEKNVCCSVLCDTYQKARDPVARKGHQLPARRQEEVPQSQEVKVTRYQPTRWKKKVR